MYCSRMNPDKSPLLIASIGLAPSSPSLGRADVGRTGSQAPRLRLGGNVGEPARQPVTLFGPTPSYVFRDPPSLKGSLLVTRCGFLFWGLRAPLGLRPMHCAFGFVVLR